MLNGWNKLSFENEQEYYETLGFLSKEKPIIGIIYEENHKAGAGGAQGKLTISSLFELELLPKALERAFSSSNEERISETKYVRNLKKMHGFTREIDNSGRDFTKHILPDTFETVLSTVPDRYVKDFMRGYHWNCEVVKHIRSKEKNEVNLDNETQHESAGGHSEGKKKVYYTTKYERNSKNREDAIRIHGAKCMICGFDFEKKYGELGKGYIEVHHIKPLSKLDEEVVVNPETDLICVCSNCHRMLHRFKSYMVSVEELKQLVEDNEK